MTEKLADLLNRLTVLTNQGKIKWEETAKRGFYQYSFPSYTVQIGEDPDEDPNFRYVLRVINNNNVVMEQVTPSDLQPHIFNAFDVMRELHVNAKREALGTEKALDDILLLLKEKEGK